MYSPLVLELGTCRKGGEPTKILLGPFTKSFTPGGPFVIVETGLE